MPSEAGGALRPTGPPGQYPPKIEPPPVRVKAPPPAYAHLPMVGEAKAKAKAKMPPGVPVKAPPDYIIQEVMSQLQPKIQPPAGPPPGWKPTLHPPPAATGPMATLWGAALHGEL